jgi:hypothetical protein
VSRCTRRVEWHQLMLTVSPRRNFCGVGARRQTGAPSTMISSCAANRPDDVLDRVLLIVTGNDDQNFFF